FGHGLSYTTFETSGLRLHKSQIRMGENLELSVDVKNTGARAGKETVLVYLNDVAASVSRPVKQLKAFRKVELKPGHSETLRFTLTPQDMSFIGPDMKRIVEAGEFEVMVGQQGAVFNVVNQ
ncbi:MAG: fibronectin type III-like domain-contianing protein, partial [Methylomonas sp.]|nr:fibronectin type III-like domain-contianing protein [Methylomonas sp.]